VTTPSRAVPGYAGHFISAPWRSSGKSMLSMGLARAASRRDISVQTFKKGPDYIDPLWLKAASYKPCYNLDPYLQSEEEFLQTYHTHMDNMMLVEGTMGLHDGLALDGSDSNGAIAKTLGLPVLLVIDCRGMHRTIASLINGIVQFDPDINYSGIILNNIRSARHASKIESAISEYCDVNVLGVIPEQLELRIDERELGLVPAPAHPMANDHIDRIANLVEASCDIDKLCECNSMRREQVSVPGKDNASAGCANDSLRIAIAQDEAFHFYYEDDLERLRARGASLVPFSPLRDTFPSDVDGVLIGGGFPERHGAALADNQLCRAGLAEAIGRGLPVRAECGGLMYLCQSIEMDNVVWPMVAAIDGVVTMHKSAKGRGYMNMTYNPSCKNANANKAYIRKTHTNNKDKLKTFRAHEFHHSQITFQTPPEYAFIVTRGHGIDSQHDGVCVHNVVASYAHFRHTEATPWIDWFLDSIQIKNCSVKTTNHV